MGVISLYFAAVCQFCLIRVASSSFFIFRPDIAYELKYRVVNDVIYSLSETVMEVAMCKSLNYSLQQMNLSRKYADTSRTMRPESLESLFRPSIEIGYADSFDASGEQERIYIDSLMSQRETETGLLN